MRGEKVQEVQYYPLQLSKKKSTKLSFHTVSDVKDRQAITVRLASDCKDQKKTRHSIIMYTQVVGKAN